MPQQRYLLVKGCAGIGNRLFTLASAIKYATETNRAIIVDWRDGVFSHPSKNAFDLLFSLKGIQYEKVETIPVTGASFYPASLSGNIDERLYANYRAAASKNLIEIPGIRKLRGRLSRLSEFWQYNKADNFGDQLYSDIAAIKALFSSNSIEYGHKLSLKIKQDVVLFADYWPGEINKKYFSFIELKADLKKRIENTTRQFGITEKTVGVHIRYTDKKPGKELDSLIAKIEREAKETNIFLSTDNQEIERSIHAILKEKIVTLPKYYPETNGNNNMHHASLKSGNYDHAERLYEECVTDAFLLAACGKFYYQGNSSFSKLALMFANKNQKSVNWLRGYAI